MKHDYHNMIVITNRHLVSGDFMAQIDRVLTLTPKSLILREKDLSDSEYLSLARDVFASCKRASIPFFVHGRVAVAKIIGCSKIHLPMNLFTTIVSDAGDETLQGFDEISVSCHSIEDVLFAQRNGATQIVLGTIFETECKPGLAGRGVSFVTEAAKISNIPIYAIGGITPDNLSLVIDAGASGGCMMSGFMSTNVV